MTRSPVGTSGRRRCLIARRRPVRRRCSITRLTAQRLPEAVEGRLAPQALQPEDGVQIEPGQGPYVPLTAVEEGSPLGDPVAVELEAVGEDRDPPLARLGGDGPRNLLEPRVKLFVLNRLDARSHIKNAPKKGNSPGIMRRRGE